MSELLTLDALLGNQDEASPNLSSIYFDKALSSFASVNGFDILDLTGLSQDQYAKSMLFEVEFSTDLNAAGLGPTFSPLIGRLSGAATTRSFNTYMDDSPEGQVKIQTRGINIDLTPTSTTGLNDDTFHKYLFHVYEDMSSDVWVRILLDGVENVAINHGSNAGFLATAGNINIASDGSRYCTGEFRNIKFFDWSRQYSVAEVNSYASSGTGLESDLYEEFKMDNYTDLGSGDGSSVGVNGNQILFENMPANPLIIR